MENITQINSEQTTVSLPALVNSTLQVNPVVVQTFNNAAAATATASAQWQGPTATNLTNVTIVRPHSPSSEGDDAGYSSPLLRSLGSSSDSDTASYVYPRSLGSSSDVEMHDFSPFSSDISEMEEG